MNKTKTHVNAPIPSNRTILTFLSVISLFISNYINGVIHLIFLCASWGSASRHYRHCARIGNAQVKWLNFT